MNPIALLAFIAGIGTSGPSPKQVDHTVPQAHVEREKVQKPQPVPGAMKRGGWDGN